MSTDPPTGSTPTPVRREGGRSARVREAVHRAVAELIAEQGPEHLTMPAVAARAGVNPTTVYRRWGDLHRLLDDVAGLRLRPNDPAPDTGSLREDLLLWAEQTRTTITTPEVLALLRASVGRAATTPGPSPRMAAREQQLTAVLAGAERRGEPCPTPQQAMDHLLAPLYFRVILGLGPVTADYSRTLVEDLLRNYAH
ncbi:TetR/AcrR family transcriptional regulator [Kitasatospora griseola]|uniref:TetR/AcrR family transcriptional regulator n=1 Tax=Kitasatospora griseola TaxID=2064 RepID=UPI0038242538